MINTFTFNGRTSSEFGVYISGLQSFDTPQKSIETIVVPGRNGTLTIDNNRYENIPVSFLCFIPNNFKTNYESLRNFLLSGSAGYLRLEDTYHPNEYRMARYVKGIEPDLSQMIQSGSFTLEFDCEPQRFLTSGETVTELTADGTINNPTLFNSKPLIRVCGSGVLTIGSTQLTITTAGTAYIDIDSEAQDISEGTTNRNSNVELTEFPELVPGDNGIVIGAGISKVQITPRWWQL